MMKALLSVALGLLAVACSPSRTGPQESPPTTSAAATSAPAVTAPAAAASPGGAAAASTISLTGWFGPGGSLPADSKTLAVETSESTCEEGRVGTSRPTMTTSSSGSDLKVEVKGHMTYCSTNGKFTAAENGDRIYLVAARPTAVSRCSCVRDLTFTVHGVKAGEHRVAFVEEPYVRADGESMTGIAMGTATTK